MKRVFFTAFMFPLLLWANSFDFTTEDSLFIGSVIELKVNIIKTKDESLNLPLVDTIVDFELLDFTQNQNLDTTQLHYRFIPFRTGEIFFPKLAFKIKKNSETLDTLFTTQKSFFVHSLIDDSTTTITDIKPPLAIRFGFLEYLIPLSIIAFFVIVFLVARRFKKNKKLKPNVVVDDRPAHVRALEMLEALTKKNLLDRFEFVQFYFELTYILKLFLELKYSFAAVEMTTFEIRQKMSFSRINNWEAIVRLLEFADMVKFAKQIPPQKETEKSVIWLKIYLQSFDEEISSQASEQRNNV